MNKNLTPGISPKNKKNPVVIILIVSIIIHLLIVVIFLTIDFRHSLSQAVKAFQEKIQTFPRTELPASLKPKQSNFGNPVMFDSPPEPEKKPQDAAPEQTQKEAESQNPSRSLSRAETRDSDELLPPAPDVAPEDRQDVAEKLNLIEKKLDKTTEKLKEEDTEPPIDSPSIRPDGLLRVADTKKELEPKKPSALEFVKPEVKKQKPQQVKAPQKEHLKKEQTPASLRSSLEPIEGPTTKRVETLQQSQKPIQKTPEQKPVQAVQTSTATPQKRNIIAMTNGFIQNLKNTGDDLFERKGDDNKRPDFSEYKYISYNANLFRQLQESFLNNPGKSKKDKYDANRHNIYKRNPIIEFVIDQYGNIVHLQLIRSSGNTDLDNVILEDTKNAAPFPPIPEHFKTEHYPIKVEIIL